MIKKKIWKPNNFTLETKSIWRFSERGDWAVHSGRYRGNWSPYIPRNLLLRYSKENDIVLDQFVGGGTTLIEAKLLNRRCIGVDINRSSLNICAEMLKNCTGGAGKVKLYNGDARKLTFLPDEYIDLIATHPPYANIIKYSDNNPYDLSLLEVQEFLHEMRHVALECHRVLKDGKVCAIMMGDLRKHGNVIPLGFYIMRIFQKSGFTLKEIVIKEQFNCSSTSFWLSNKRNNNFLLLAHEYLLIFYK